jgi:hypothetical protein
MHLASFIYSVYIADWAHPFWPSQANGTSTKGAFSNQVDCFQIAFGFHVGSLAVPSRAFTPYCSCESAINAAFCGLTSPANDAGNLALSSSK